MNDKKKELSAEEIEKVKDFGTGHGDRLEAIAKSVSKAHLEEAGVEPLEEEEETEPDKPEESAKEETPEPDKPKKKEKKSPDTDMITLKVDGEEVEKPKIEVDEHGGIKAYQLELAAQKRIQSATLKQKELEEREAKLAEREAALKKPLPTDDDIEDEEEETEKKIPAKKDADKDLKKLKDIVAEKSKAYLRTQEFGEEDEIEMAFQEMKAAEEDYNDAKYKGAAATQAFDVDKVADQITPKVVENLSAREIVSKFEKAFPKIVSDPLAYKTASSMVPVICKEKGTSGEDWETYELVGKRVMLLMGWEEPDPTPAQKEDDLKRQQKIEKKRKIENIDAATAKTESGKTEEKQQTREEIIQEMSSKRIGQRTY